MPAPTKDSFVEEYVGSGLLSYLAFTSDGQDAYVGGEDGLARRYDMNASVNEEPSVFEGMDGEISALTANNKYWLAAAVDSDVRRFTAKTSPNTQNNYEVIYQPKAVTVRALSINPAGTRVAIASDETFVKIIELEDITQVQSLDGGHSRGVRGVSWDPSGTLVTTTGADGKIVVWEVNQTPFIRHTLERVVLPIVNDDSPQFKHDASAIWHPSSPYIYVLSGSNDVKIINTAMNWESKVFASEETGSVLSAISLSPNGLYLAAAAKDRVSIWSTEVGFNKAAKPVVRQEKVSKGFITRLAFSPSQHLLAWTDSVGGLYRWWKPIPSSLPDSCQRSAKDALKDDLFDAMPDIPLDDDDNDTHMQDVLNQPEDDLDDYGDAERAYAEERKRHRAGRSGLLDKNAREVVSITEAQPPFQPGATPGKQARYLAHSLLGVVEATVVDDERLAVTVSSFDRSARPSYNFTTTHALQHGYIGERGVVFAYDAEEGLYNEETNETESSPARVVYKPYGSKGEKLDWTYTLNGGTKVMGVAAGGVPSNDLTKGSDRDLEGLGNVVVATDEGDLTFLSGTGRERRIMGLGADFLTMAASDEWVFVVYRPGSTTIDGSQNLWYSLIRFDDFSVMQKGILPLARQVTLQWAGITTEGAPAIYDSAGYVHILAKYRVPHHASWARVLDSNALERRKGKDESYWAVGVTDSTFMCLILKGKQKFPGFPRPLIQEIDIRLPFRKDEPANEALEREFMLLEASRDALGDELSSDDVSTREHAIDKELIKLVQGACKDSNLPRALELTKLLNGTHSFDMAAKIGDFYKMPGFTEKVLLLKEDRQDAEDRLEEARERRQRWIRTDAAPRRLSVPTDTSSSVTRLFASAVPPEPVRRPGLERAVPVVEHSRFSSNAAAAMPPPTPAYSESLPPTSESKRKRDEFDDVEEQSSYAPPPSKQSMSDLSALGACVDSDTEANPFARKPGQDTSRNPFAKRAADSNKTIQKSESFFEKVDAAETGTQKAKRGFAAGGKDKKKEGGPRQTTLFGLPPGPGNDAKRLKKKGSEAKAAAETQATSQMADVPMSDALVSATPQVLVPCSQLEGPDTQLDDLEAQNTDTQDTETQLEGFESQEEFMERQVVETQ
ncbi:hypothetical protein BD626DRAFT_422291 [Schizophyllum amplum]|uniref:Uncharacterized protein n=1 Tax=Schizophyllum amplum TaxID=97359 RepID=A0A550CYH7_9AGAR|nr:hypothetical protein BD626DRAFT_422291 [Auriculariopsis ampla]